MRVKKARKSGIELLRIIAIVLIISHHYVNHGGYGNFTVNEFGLNVVYLQMISLFGKTGCSIFAIITGHFMYKNTIRGQEYYKKIVPLIFESIFYAFFAIAIVSVLGGDWSKKDLLLAPLAFIKGNWYLTTYIAFWFFIPYLNIFIDSIDKQTFQRLLIAIFVLYFVGGIATFTIGAYDPGFFVFMCVMYFIGAYTKKYADDFEYENRKNLAYGLIFAALMMGSVLLMDLFAITLKKDIILYHALDFQNYNNFLSLGTAFFIFLFFLRLDFHSNIINYISSTTIGIYLFHDNKLMWQILWGGVFSNIAYFKEPYLHAVIKISIVFFCGVLIDFFRQILFWVIKRVCDIIAKYIHHVDKT